MKSNARTRTLRKGKGRPLAPPPLRSNVLVNHTFRFQAQSAGTYQIDAQNLIRSCGLLAISTTSSYAIADTVKLHSVEMWSPYSEVAGITPGANTIACEWNNDRDFAVSTSEISDTAVSISKPAHIFTRPPSGTVASFWLKPLAGLELFTLTVVQRTIIDLHVSFIIIDGAPLTSTTVAISGGTVGRVYYSYLDSIGGELAPVQMTPPP